MRSCPKRTVILEADEISQQMTDSRVARTFGDPIGPHDILEHKLNHPSLIDTAANPTRGGSVARSTYLAPTQAAVEEAESQKIVQQVETAFTDQKMFSKGLNGQYQPESGPRAVRDDGSQEAPEVVKVIRERGYIVQKDSTHSGPANLGSAASNKSENQVTCQVCKKFKGRPCELK